MDTLKMLLRIPISDTTYDNLLRELLSQSEAEFKDYTGCNDVPASAQYILCEMARIKYNTLGAEGLASQSYNGMTETYQGYPSSLITALNKYRHMRCI